MFISSQKGDAKTEKETFYKKNINIKEKLWTDHVVVKIKQPQKLRSFVRSEERFFANQIPTERWLKKNLSQTNYLSSSLLSSSSSVFLHFLRYSLACDSKQNFNPQ